MTITDSPLIGLIGSKDARIESEEESILGIKTSISELFVEE